MCVSTFIGNDLKQNGQNSGSTGIRRWSVKRGYHEDDERGRYPRMEKKNKK